MSRLQTLTTKVRQGLIRTLINMANGLIPEKNEARVETGQDERSLERDFRSPRRTQRSARKGGIVVN